MSSLRVSHVWGVSLVFLRVRLCLCVSLCPIRTLNFTLVSVSYHSPTVSLPLSPPPPLSVSLPLLSSFFSPPSINLPSHLRTRTSGPPTLNLRTTPLLGHRVDGGTRVSCRKTPVLGVTGSTGNKVPQTRGCRSPYLRGLRGTPFVSPAVRVVRTRVDGSLFGVPNGPLSSTPLPLPPDREDPKHVPSSQYTTLGKGPGYRGASVPTQGKSR